MSILLANVGTRSRMNIDRYSHCSFDPQLTQPGKLQLRAPCPVSRHRPVSLPQAHRSPLSSLKFDFFLPWVSEIMQFCVWLIPFRMRSSRPIRGVENGRSPSF